MTLPTRVCSNDIEFLKRVKINVWSSSKHQPVSVMVTHMPTGIMVQKSDMSRYKAEKDALASLKELVDKFYNSVGEYNMDTFEEELRSLINRYSLENGSDTPDYLLAEYLRRCLENYNETVSFREHWHGRKLFKDRQINEEISTGIDLCGNS